MEHQKKSPPVRHSDWRADETNPAIVPAIRPGGKAFASLQAAFALRGHWLEQMEDGSFMAGCHAYCKPLESLEDVYRHLRQIGGAA